MTRLSLKLWGSGKSVRSRGSGQFLGDSVSTYSETDAHKNLQQHEAHATPA